VQLYIKNVYIMNDCKELVPSWLRFLKGVVDSEDLPLNISREILQEDPLIPVIRKSLTRRVLNALKRTMSSDEEKYRTFWSEFGPILKEALVPQPGTEEEHREAVLDLCLFSSASSDRGLVSLKEYVASMKEGQEHIYYLTGRRIEALRSSPLLERCLDLGYDALLLTDPVDEVAASFLTEYEGKPFRSLEVEDALPDAREDTREKPSELAVFLKEALGSLVKDVRLSTRLTSSPACLVGDKEDSSFAMERILRSMGQTPPPVQRILEINGDHPVLRGLERRLADADRAEREELKEYAFLLYDQCVLAEGGQLDDPGTFARRVSRLMDRSLAGEDDLKTP
jgi:molecular chaperone HtpG